MSTDSSTSTPVVSVPEQEDATNATTAPTTPPTPVTPSTPTGEKKLSNKELKELKKLEKAAKRAAAKVATGGPVDPSPPNANNQQQKGNNAQQQQQQQQKNAKPKTASHIKKQMELAKVKEDNHKIPPMFGHLETREQRISSSPQIANIVHPSILSLTLKISTYRIVGSTARCKAMLFAFKDVIASYTTPEGTSLTRNLTSHLSHQIEYLKTGRPLSISMGNTIRWLKQRISLIPIDMPDLEAKNILCEQIDQFISEKIDYSDKVITQMASKHINNGSKILTYGHSEVLKQTFKYCAIEANKNFEIVIVDSKPLFEGKKLAKELSNIPNIKCHYALINSLSSVLENSDVDTVFLGAHSMLSNGRLYSRVGTALIAMSANNKNIPVLVCCESIKFSDKVQLDSVTLNELGDGDDLVNTKPFVKNGFNLEQYLKTLELEKSAKDQQQQSNNKQNKKQQQNKQKENANKEMENDSTLSNWKEITKLNILNILYDLTPPEYIQKIITEVGALPPSSVPVILREYKASA
ncbi:hypothetical protein BVG19_g1397 [[Candida] boidinii]|nr:hypothetical protein BVG19_g1397 [[Candida] boidinii]OWB50888.1 hypothetical protein B5S27_g2441 [[Candida] boidinii]